MFQKARAYRNEEPHRIVFPITTFHKRHECTAVQKTSALSKEIKRRKAFQVARKVPGDPGAQQKASKKATAQPRSVEFVVPHHMMVPPAKSPWAAKPLSTAIRHTRDHAVLLFDREHDRTYGSGPRRRLPFAFHFRERYDAVAHSVRSGRHLQLRLQHCTRHQLRRVYRGSNSNLAPFIAAFTLDPGLLRTDCIFLLGLNSESPLNPAHLSLPIHLSREGARVLSLEHFFSAAAAASRQLALLHQAPAPPPSRGDHGGAGEAMSPRSYSLCQFFCSFGEI